MPPAPKKKIAHITGILHRMCLNLSDFSWFDVMIFWTSEYFFMFFEMKDLSMFCILAWSDKIISEF